MFLMLFCVAPLAPTNPSSSQTNMTYGRVWKMHIGICQIYGAMVSPTFLHSAIYRSFKTLTSIDSY